MCSSAIFIALAWITLLCIAWCVRFMVFWYCLIKCKKQFKNVKLTRTLSVSFESHLPQWWMIVSVINFRRRLSVSYLINVIKIDISCNPSSDIYSGKIKWHGNQWPLDGTHEKRRVEKPSTCPAFPGFFYPQKEKLCYRINTVSLPKMTENDGCVFVRNTM